MANNKYIPQCKDELISALQMALFRIKGLSENEDDITLGSINNISKTYWKASVDFLEQNQLTHA